MVKFAIWPKFADTIAGIKDAQGLPLLENRNKLVTENRYKEVANLLISYENMLH